MAPGGGPDRAPRPFARPPASALARARPYRPADPVEYGAVLIGEIIGVLVVIGAVAAVIFRRRSHDDVHSVEGYHRQLHTLEEIRAHTPAAGRENGNGDAPFPASAFRVAGSSSVRLTEPGKAVVPPVPPPPVPNPAEPVTFDDAGPSRCRPRRS